MSAAAEVRWDPFDAAFRADPYPYYERLRAEQPAHRNELRNLVLSRYDDVARTLRGNEFSRDVAANARHSDDPLVQRERARANERAKSILNLDPPDHTRLRRLVSKAFTPSAIDRLRPRIEALVEPVLDRAEERGAFELIDELAFPVPFLVISEMLAMPTDRADELRDWSQAITASLEPTATLAELDGARAAVEELIPHLIAVIEERRGKPGDDVLSALLEVEEQGDRLSHEELITFVVLLYVAGHETTVNLIGNGVLALLRNPAQLAAWHRDPSIGEHAVEELLRYDGPVQHTVRVAMQTVAYDDGHGGIVEAEPGDTVLCLLGSANHDPAIFDVPGELRLDRANANRHLAFSAGIHYCLGASLAKLEAAVVIGRLVERFSSIELDGEPHWRDRLTIRGVDRLALNVRR